MRSYVMEFADFSGVAKGKMDSQKTALSCHKVCLFFNFVYEEPILLYHQIISHLSRRSSSMRFAMFHVCISYGFVPLALDHCVPPRYSEATQTPRKIE